LVPALSAAIAEATWLPQEAAEDGGLRGESALALRNEWRNFEAAVVGPGMGLSDETRALTWALVPDLAELPHGAVLDADALNALAGMPEAAERLPSNVVLTPHPGEMARLLDTTVADVQARRLQVTREAAERFGCVVVLKGAHTVVSAPDGRTGLSPYANPLLASAGTGDVLAGMIGAYLSQGCAPFEAACLGVYLHAATGEALRQEFGESGLLASDLCNRLPLVVKEVKA
jgi:NAD(P)H-hydrate epimerase